MGINSLFSDERVKLGPWFDYESRRTLLLLDNATVLYIHALVVFFAALCAKNVALIVNRLLQLAGQKSGRAVFQHKTLDDAAIEHQPLLSAALGAGHGTQANTDYGTSASGGSNNPLAAAHPETGPRPISVASSHSRVPFLSGGRDSTWNTLVYIRNKKNPHKLWVFICWIMLMVALFGVFAFGVVAPSLITTGKSALWASDVCGIWEFPTDDTTDEESTRRDVILRQKEARAGEYAKYCYEPWSSNQPLPVYCNFFAHRSIPFERKLSHRCPFKNITVCQGSDVITFDTGKLPSSYLGINQKHPRQFRRTATCVPLNVNEPYVKEIPGKVDPSFIYNYGTLVDTGEPLFDTKDNPFNWTAPTYDASIFTTGPGIDDYWTPIEDLKQPGNEALTLLFIRPLQLYYLKPSGDPLFPTDHQKTFSNGDVWYIKKDPKARVLACLDETQLCDPTGETCWSATNHHDTIRDDSGYWLMKLSLKDSTIYNSISLRLGTALVAQEMLSQQLSLPIADDHWMAEAERLFATSLALSQLKAWSISSGEDHAREADLGWEDQTPDEATDSGGLCNLLKFKSTGYTDIDLKAFVLLLILPYFLTGLLSMRWNTCLAIWSWLRSWWPSDPSEEGNPPQQSSQTAPPNPSSSTTQQSSGDSGDTMSQGIQGTANGSIQAVAARRRARQSQEAENGDADRLSRGSTLIMNGHVKEVKIEEDSPDRLLLELVCYCFYWLIQQIVTGMGWVVRRIGMFRRNRGDTSN